MSGASVVVIETGVANTASVLAALRRCGAEAELSADASRVSGASRVVLPGVGAFGAGMESLRANGLDEVVRERVRDDLPLLGICLGMQLLFESSDESPGVEGLGVVPGHVGRFAEGVRVPQFGWNRVEAEGDGWLESGWAYFANSYRVEAAPDGWEVATAQHGGPFVAAMRRGSVVTCQFHPELSGAWGQVLIGSWLASERMVSPC